MSTKISKGARAHLLRVVERLQYPWIVYRPGVSPWWSRAVRNAAKRIAERARHDGAVFVLPSWAEMAVVWPSADST